MGCLPGTAPGHDTGAEPASSPRHARGDTLAIPLSTTMYVPRRARVEVPPDAGAAKMTNIVRVDIS